MAKNKNNQTTLIIMLIVILILATQQKGCDIFITQEKGNGDGDVPDTTTVPTTTVLNNCVDVCHGENYDTGYDLSDRPIQARCMAGETQVNYGYTGQTPILRCCCYDIEPEPADEPDDEWVPVPVDCNDWDNTQYDFDNSIRTASQCNDNLGVHYDQCDDGLLQEWSCPQQSPADCSHAFINCDAFFPGTVCSLGRCV